MVQHIQHLLRFGVLQPMAGGIKRGLLYLVSRGIASLWVEPLEIHVIPRLATAQPTWLRGLLLPWAVAGAKIGRVVVLDVRLAVEHWVGPDWSVAYIGEGKSVKLLEHLLFPVPPTVQALPRVFLWQVPGLVRKFANAGELVVCEINDVVSPPSRGYQTFFVVPLWISQVLEEIQRPLEDILAGMNQTTRRQLRRLEKQGFSYEFTQAEADFDLFYNRMYLPYIQARHGGLSLELAAYDGVKRLFRQGGLILVKQGQEPVCGMVGYLAGDTYCARQMGVLDGNFDLVKLGTNFALWWYMLDWARRQGARHFHFGDSRAQTSNGVFKFKRQWGTRVRATEGQHASWMFFGDDLAPPVREQINAQGFIIRRDDRHYRLVLLGRSETGHDMNLALLLSEAAACGLAGLAVMSAEGKTRVVSV